MAFSTGAHVCLGAWLGRTTVRVAVQHFFERFPTAALADDVEIRGFEFRGPSRLLVTT
jgi:cytochrome P450